MSDDKFKQRHAMRGGTQPPTPLRAPTTATSSSLPNLIPPVAIPSFQPHTHGALFSGQQAPISQTLEPEIRNNPLVEPNNNGISFPLNFMVASKNKFKALISGGYRKVAPSITSSQLGNSLAKRSQDHQIFTLDSVQVNNNNNVVPQDVTDDSNNWNESSCPVDDCPHRSGSVESCGNVCRICHDDDSTIPFITPCLCKGTMGLVHQQCLERWLGESGKTVCEICGYEYSTQRKPKYFGCHSVCAWVREPTNHRDTKNLFFDIACFFILTPLAGISAWLCVMGSQQYAAKENKSEQSRTIPDPLNTTWTSIGLLTLTGTLLMAYYIWLIIAFRYHYQVWRDWQNRNYFVTVLPIQPATSRGTEVHSGSQTQIQVISTGRIGSAQGMPEGISSSSSSQDTLTMNGSEATRDEFESKTKKGQKLTLSVVQPTNLRQVSSFPRTTTPTMNTFNNNPRLGGRILGNVSSTTVVSEGGGGCGIKRIPILENMFI